MRKNDLDPRIQIIILFLIGFMVLFANVKELLWLNGYMIIYLMINGKYKQTITSSIVLIILYGLHNSISQSSYQVVRLLGFFTFLGLRFRPIMLVSSVLQDVPSGKLVASLQRLHIPKNIVITLSVMLRFFPMIQYEYETIQISAKLRGLSWNQIRNWVHPLRSFEYAVVPLMMRTLKISDELAASAATKGIEYPKPRTSIYAIQTSLLDYMILILFLIGCILVFFLIA